MLAVAFGGLLIVAGLAKLLVIGPPAASGVLTLLMPSWALATVPVIEIALGVWLISGRWRFGAWLVALVTLGVFCLVNLESVAAGKSSCGCLGAASPLPGVMLALDGIAAVLFVWHRPRWAGWPDAGPELQVALTAFLTVTVTLSLAATAAYLRYGSIAVALADARGDALAVTPRVVDVGFESPESRVERPVTFDNLTSESVAVTAAYVNCDCVTVRGLPLELSAGGRGVVTLVVDLPGKPGPVLRSGYFRTSAGKVPFGIRSGVVGVE